MLFSLPAPFQIPADFFPPRQTVEFSFYSDRFYFEKNIFKKKIFTLGNKKGKMFSPEAFPLHFTKPSLSPPCPHPNVFFSVYVFIVAFLVFNHAKKKGKASASIILERNLKGRSIDFSFYGLS